MVCAPNGAELLAVALVVAAVTTANLIWIHIDEHPPHWDMGGHLSSSLLYNRYLANFDVVTFFGTYIVYPPLVYWLTQPFYLIFGKDISVAVASQTIFLAILAFSTYGIGRELWSKRTGLLAVFFVLASPFLVSQFKEYQLDAPLASMTALSLFLLIKSREFSDRRYSLLLGVALGLSMLTKWPFAFVIAFPMTYALAVAFLNRHSDARPLWNVLHVAVIGLVIAAPWYLGAHRPVPRRRAGYCRRHTVLARVTPRSFLGVRSSATSGCCVNGQLYLVPFLAFCTGLVVMLLDRQHARRNLYPLCLIAGCYVLFTLLATRTRVHRADDVRRRHRRRLLDRTDLVPGSRLPRGGGRRGLHRRRLSGDQLRPAPRALRQGGAHRDESVRLLPSAAISLAQPTGDDWYQEEIIRTVAA